jgi:homoserine kinase type II
MSPRRGSWSGIIAPPGRSTPASSPRAVAGARQRAALLLTRLYDWLNQTAGALVRPKDPLEYLKKLRFHRGVTDPAAYGIDA